jgi:DNA-binding MurR/RpiR family transcriptional regulator
VPGLSEGQKAVADFILREYEKAAFMTASKLGQGVGVSESTVVRFAVALGYDGYPEMRQILQDMVRSRLTTVYRLLGSVEGREAKDSVLARVMQGDIDNIRQTLHETSPESFEQAVQLILGARRVYVTGLRSAASLATFMSFCLNWVLGNAHALISGVEDWLEQMIDLRQEDLVIAISFPRYTRKTVEIVQHAREQGAKVLAITDSVISPLARHATVVLPAKSQIQSYIDSFTAPLSLINSILTAVAQRQRDRTLASLNRLEAEWKKYRVFCEP